MMPKTHKAKSGLLKKITFLVGAACITALAINFILSRDNSDQDARREEVQSMTTPSDGGLVANKDESYRYAQPPSSLVIYGYNREQKAPVRTLVTYNGQPLLLNRPLNTQDNKNGLDLVRMKDGRVFLCQHESNENCWRVINGTSKLVFP